ncbi:efflux RND transporter periplasmic adaptor subunit [Reyranella sp.]|uniref:efflux RND transporter periplasmic adaptor subunit n=1 Tax=Reyranella sp. TaxID=1929291 RepID=UPI002F9367F4
MRWLRAARAGLVLALLATGSVAAQQAQQAPAVGVVDAARHSITQSSEYVGRIQATNRVNLVARVAAFLEEVLFTEGAEVKKGDLLFRLEQAPFRADVQARQAAVAQFKAQLLNAQSTLARAQALLKTPAGQQANVDTAVANEQALQAQVLGAEAQLQQATINLGYTEIRAPIDGKIGRTSVTVGNYVGPGTLSGVLTSIVSQDPMYVVFPISTRTAIELQQRTVRHTGTLIVRLRLPDGRIYGQTGKLNFVDNSVSANTDTMTLRGAVPNPRVSQAAQGARELVDGELVTVILEEPEPTEVLTVPRAAVLADQQGDYVFVVGADNKAEQRRVKLGQSTPALASVTSGLSEGEKVIVDGIQRVRAGQLVSPGPAAPPAGARATRAN